MRRCEECFKPFEHRHGNQVTCGEKACLLKRNAKAVRKYKAKLKERKAPEINGKLAEKFLYC